MTETTLSRQTLTHLSELMNRDRKEMVDEIRKFSERISASTVGGGKRGLTGVTGDDTRQLKELERVIEIFKRHGKTLTAHEKYMLGAARREKKVVEDRLKQAAAEQAARDQNTDSIENNSDAHNDNTNAVRWSAEETKRFAKNVVQGIASFQALHRVVDEVRQSYKFGFKWDPITDAFNSALMGMDPKTMMEFQAQFRRTSGAMSGGINQFNEMVKQNQSEMIQYTGSMKAAAFAMGGLYEISHNMGLNLEDVSGSASSLFDEFKKMQLATSMTIDEFQELAKSLVGDADVRSKLLVLQKQQRAAYIQGLIAQTDQMRALGMQKEAAEQLVKYTESLSNQRPIDRMQQSVKLQMLAGVMGMDSSSAARLQQLHSKRTRSGGENLEFIELMKALNARRFELMGSGPMINSSQRVNEFQIQGLTDSLNLTEMLDQFNDANLQSSAKRDPIALASQSNEIQERQIDWLQKILHQTTMISDQLSGWGASAAAALAGSVLALIMSRKGGMLDRAINQKNSGFAASAANPAPGAQASWLNRAIGRVGWGIGGLGIGVAGTMAADMMFDPSKANQEDKETTTYANAAMKWGSIGAGAGLAFSPLGALVGGALGAAGGVLMAHRDWQKDYSNKAQEVLSLSTKMVSADQQRLKAERTAREQELRMLEMRVGSTADEETRVRRIAELKRQIAGIDDQQSVAQLKRIAMSHTTAGSIMSELSSKKSTFTDTDDLLQRSNQLQSLLGVAGVKGNAKSVIMEHIQNAALTNNDTSTETWSAFSDLERAMEGNKDINIPAPLRKYVTQGVMEAQRALQTKIDDNLAQIRMNADPSMLSSAVKSAQGDVAEAAENVERAKRELEDLRKNANAVDPFGFNQTAMIAEKQKQLAQAEAALKASQEAAEILNKSASGEAPLVIELSDTSARTLAKLIKNSNPTRTYSAAKPQQG